MDGCVSCARGHRFVCLSTVNRQLKSWPLTAMFEPRVGFRASAPNIC